MPTVGKAHVELTIDDVKQLALELWLAQRENAQLREANEMLRRANAELSERAGAGGRQEAQP